MASGHAHLTVAGRPLAAGSVSLRLYPHDDLAGPAVVDELRAQAALACTHGFDGVMTSEHHGGFGGYLPNPAQVAGWMLEAMPRGWAAPCPMLITLRPTALVAEEVAWLAMRFPGRVGVGVAAGGRQEDFDIMGVGTEGLTERFSAALGTLAAMFGGTDAGVLAGDPAIARCRLDPIPVVSAAMGRTAARRAAACGVGIIVDSLSSPQRGRTLVDFYRAAGGTGACVLIRRAWLGSPPRERLDDQVGVYRTYASRSAQAHWGPDEVVVGDDPVTVARGLSNVLQHTGADALNLRLHVPGVDPEAIRQQIVVLGDEVIPRIVLPTPQARQSVGQRS